jgi:hypothetical protein
MLRGDRDTGPVLATLTAGCAVLATSHVDRDLHDLDPGDRCRRQRVHGRTHVEEPMPVALRASVGIGQEAVREVADQPVRRRPGAVRVEALDQRHSQIARTPRDRAAAIPRAPMATGRRTAGMSELPACDGGDTGRELTERVGRR